MAEKRAIFTEVRSDGAEGEKRVSGVGIVYDQWTELWPGYKERIRKGAAKPHSIVKSYFNHDPSKVLSTSESNPPVKFKSTDGGVEFDSPIPPTSYGKDLEINLERGNVKGASFSFDVEDQKRWDEGGVHYRDITSLLWYEMGPVTDPAYVQTKVNLRSAEEALHQWRATQEPDSRNLRERRQKLIEGDI